MSWTFEKVDEILKSYGLERHIILGDGIRCYEYAFKNRESETGKKNVATDVRPLINGGVGGYIYVAYLDEYKFKKDAPSGYKFIKSAKEHVKISNFTEEELRNLLERVVNYYK
jgi:hypothetical protein